MGFGPKCNALKGDGPGNALEGESDESDVDQDEGFEKFSELTLDLKKYILKFCLEGESTTTVFSKIAQLRAVSREFNTLFHDEGLLKELFLKCTFPNKLKCTFPNKLKCMVSLYSSSQVACLTEYLAYIGSKKELSDKVESLILVLSLGWFRYDLYSFFREELSGMMVKGKPSSGEQAGEWVMDCMLFVAFAMTCGDSDEKIKCNSILNSIMSPFAPRFKKKFLFSVKRMLGHIQKEIDGNPGVDVDYKNWVKGLTFAFDQYCCESTLDTKTPSSLTIVNLVQLSQKMFQKDMNRFSTMKSILPYIIDVFGLSEGVQELFKYAQEGDLTAIRITVGGNCQNYEQLILEIALCVAIEEGQEKTAEYLVSCLPEININKIDKTKEVVEKMGFWSDCFKAAVLHKSVRMAELLANRLITMKIHKDCASALQQKVVAHSRALTLCVGLDDFREIFFRLCSDLDISSEIMKWLQACFDCDEESIRDMGWDRSEAQKVGFFLEIVLCGAVTNGQVELVKIFLDLKNPEVTGVWSLLKQPLLYWARLKSHKEIEQLLLKIPDVV